MPKVSVIIPTYNRAHLLPAAASTVLNQTWTDLELIIVDDGSLDGTRNICMRLSAHDSRVRYIHQSNGGPSAARNTGIRAARGEYVAFLDSDDSWEPIKLERQLTCAESNPRAACVYCDWAYMDETGLTWPAAYPPDLALPTAFESLLYYNIVQAPSLMLVRMECFDRVGLFDESLHRAEDRDMWIRIARYYQFAHVPEVLAYLLEHAAQSQRNTEGMADATVRMVQKLVATMPSQFSHHTDRVTWHNLLFAAELYCSTSTRKCWYTLHLAVRAWPAGLLSPRMWYVLALSLTGPFYPQASAIGLVVRRWCRQYLKLDSVTGWRGRPAH